LYDASRMASFASAWSTPGELEQDPAGLDHRDPVVGAPLPEPIRTSAGFFVTGLSGNTRIQDLSTTLQVVDDRAPGCLDLAAVIQHGSCAWRA